MPSIWPFGRDDSSPASFERALSRLSTQITSCTVSLEKSRTRAHRSKAFWTLWSTLAYIIYTAIIALVLGPQQWEVPHYAGLAGAPIVIYGVRRVLALLLNWQIARQQGHLDRLVKERDEKIAQLKKATRYDTTQELLNKYGGTTPRAQSGENPATKRKVTPSRPAGQPQHVQRTGITPPPTANLPGRRPVTPARQGVNTITTPPPSRDARSALSSSTLYNQPGGDLSPDEPGFAPNAFSAPSSQPSAYAPDQPHKWYDRILDVLLGEDETSAKNRLALICAHCRLVNGQAPPNIRRLEEIGRWRCGSCGAWNGVDKVEHQVGRMVQEMKMKEQRDGGHSEWTRESRSDANAPEPPEVSGRKEPEEDAVGARDSETGEDTLEEVPDSPESGDGESGESEKKAAESVAERVARKRRGSRRLRE